MKLMGIILLIITIITVIMTFIIVSRLSHQVDVESEQDAVFDDSFSGTIPNAYILSNHQGEIIVLYQGTNYIAKETAESDYTGVADIEISHGKLVQIYAKPANITGILDSYKDKTVQIEGYEPLDCDGTIPVYVVSDKKTIQPDVRQGSVSDLLIGNSQVELVVAEGKACAIVCHQKNQVDNIRVLLKNGDDVLYSSVYSFS